jgi:pilus assembly protein FimV
MFRKLILASAVSLALAPAGASALGLGAIRTQSALYEPFVGEIPLKDVKADDLDNIKVGLAPNAEFKKVGAAYSAALGELKFKPQISPQGRPVIRVTSEKPIREPYLDFLLEVRSAQGRLVKEYTVLLDPPSTIRRRSPRIEEAVAEPVYPTAAEAQAQPATREAPVSGAANPHSEAGFPLHYGPVPRGKGLWQVAKAISPPGATPAQTVMALYRSNQGAFIHGDVNQLKAGAVLEIPSSAELFALDAARADRDYSMALQGHRVTAHPLAPEAVAEHPTSDHLAIMQAPPTEAAGTGLPPKGTNESNPSASKLGSLKNELMLVRESSESNRQETEDLRSRIHELEGQLGDIRKLLKLRNEQIAQLQGSQKQQPELDIGEETGVLPATVPDKPAPNTAMEDKPAPATDDLAEIDSETSRPGQAAPIDATKTMQGAAPALAAAMAVKPDAEKPDASPKPERANLPPPNPAEPPVVAAKPKTNPTTEETEKAALVPKGPKLAQLSPSAVTAKVTERVRKPADLQQAVAHRQSEIASLWESMPTSVIATAIGIPLLLFPLGWWMVHRRRLVQEAIETNQLTTAIPPRAASAPQALEPTYEGENEDASTTATESSYGDFSGMDGESGETDVASEADVYIAYGRYREAEYLLEEELSKAPERMDLKFKLAEAYFGAKNLAGLTKIRDEIAHAGGDRLHEDQWQRLTAMVRDLQAGKANQASATGAMPGRSEETGSPSEGALASTGEARIDRRPAAPESHGVGAANDSLDLSFDSERPGGADLVADKDSNGAGSGAEIELDELSAFDLDLDAVDRENRMAMQGGAEFVAPRSEEGPLDAPFGEWPDISGDGEPASLSGSVKARETLGSDLGSSQWQTDSTLWDEVSTKIDLARAYVDMADSEAARAILEEVAEEGNEAQRAEAKEILAKLA